MKRLAILGSTGSVGTKALDIIAPFPDRFRVEALAAWTNTALLAKQAAACSPRLVAVATAAHAEALRARLEDPAVEICWGRDGLRRVATYPEADLVLSAVIGAEGLEPTVEAIRAGKDVALANKESLVMAGALVLGEARARGTAIIPVDSEHSAIFQCLVGGGRAALRRVILTASGGPFRTTPKARLETVTPAEALAHPTWPMGRKISIDSATLMNKGLEVLEAACLFGLAPRDVAVLVHPQSIVHSLVEYADGSLLAQLAITDMRLPILYALTYPERLENPLPPLDLAEIGRLTFEPPDRERFPCLDLAYRAAEAGGSWPTVLNAANEVAVPLFLERRIRFTQIPILIQSALEAHRPVPVDSVETVLAVDRAVRADFGRRFPGAPSPARAAEVS